MGRWTDWPPDRVRAWLERPEGMRWSRMNHSVVMHHALIELHNDTYNGSETYSVNFAKDGRGTWWSTLAEQETEDNSGYIFIKASSIPPECV